mmetsp:Transcript_32997/g.77813  ORF Transcript_32997/g.77813 Transcript_32997/m.77813 type:complete len:294 (+) Transcript_32997:190-1071(+)
MVCRSRRWSMRSQSRLKGSYSRPLHRSCCSSTSSKMLSSAAHVACDAAESGSGSSSRYVKSDVVMTAYCASFSSCAPHATVDARAAQSSCAGSVFSMSGSHSWCLVFANLAFLFALFALLSWVFSGAWWSLGKRTSRLEDTSALLSQPLRLRRTVSVAPRGLPGALVFAAMTRIPLPFMPCVFSSSAFTSASLKCGRVTLDQDRRFQMSRTVLSAMWNFFARSLLAAVLGKKTPSLLRWGRLAKISSTAFSCRDVRRIARTTPVGDERTDVGDSETGASWYSSKVSREEENGE